MKKKIVSFAFVLVLLLSMMLIALTTTSVDANSSEIEIYYDNNASNPGGLGGTLPGGLAVNFTPPSEEYWMLKRVKFYGMRWANESYDSMPFYIEVWDKNKNELLHIAYKYSDYFKNYDSKWVTVDIPDVLVKDDFFVCIFPNMIYMPSGPSPHMNIGFNNDPPISNRSYRVRMDDNSIEWQIPGNLFIRAIVGEPIIVPDDYPTIQAAIDAANESDTIFVSSGTYYERVTIDKPLTLIGENRSNTIIDGNGTIYACIHTVLTGVHDVCISGFTIRNGCSGICIDQNSQANYIRGNIVTDNKCGIRLFRSDNNIITDNVVVNNTEGVKIGFSSGNTLVDNTISSNKYNFYVYGEYLSRFIHDIDTSNKVDGKSVYYLINQHNLIINSTTFSDVGYLGLINSTNIVVKDLNCNGILFAYTNNSTIQNVNVCSSVSGIFLVHSFENIISNNSLSKNGCGIKVYSRPSFPTPFCNNTIINNVISDNDCGILVVILLLITQ